MRLALTMLSLAALLSLSPVTAQSIKDTGLRFGERALYWESTGNEDSVILSLEAIPTAEGLTTTESVAIVVKTPAGRYEVIAGFQAGDKFYLKEYLGTVVDPMDAPAMVLGYLIGKRSLG